MLYSILACALLAPASATVELLVLGDWGGMPIDPYTTPGQRATAKGMGVVGAQLKVQAVLALGDNFYFSGIVGDETSSRFAHTWDDVYTDTSLQVPWYVIAGNHDYKGNVTAQVAYSGVSSRWTFPALYHSQSFVSAEDGTTVDVVLIDTVDLSGSSSAADESDPTYFAPLPPRAKGEAQEQWDWIEAQLAASTADYLLVGGHFPVYSLCEHGNTQNLIDHLQPLLEAHGAHYMSGHDHCMESMLSEGVQYIVSGMGDTCCYDPTNIDNVPGVQFYVSKGHKEKGTIGGFTSITASKSSLTIGFYDQDGNTLYNTPGVAARAQAHRTPKHN
ncbi:Metallo-dependent phosphatase-like protein [Ochromonadaceae sp. CCMP2298]|nr:Metallo-dependent phosphatase-like protein [Ochromonadaceae sp. CCMP2298]